MKSNRSLGKESILHFDLPGYLANYNIKNDNDGFAKWLAYQIGLQMMWTQIQKNLHRNFGVQDKFNPCSNPT